jgi:hypothetical protein
MFKHSCQTHGGLKVDGLLHLNIGAHGLIEACREEIHLVLGGEPLAAAEEGQSGRW